MIYLKCTFAGLAALFVVFVILPISATIVIFLTFAVKHGVAGIGIDRPKWHFASPVFWVSALVVFYVAFFWELRWLTK